MRARSKEKFHSAPENSVKVQVLTVLPKSWSISKIQAEFGASNFMARRAKQLVKERGVLSSPDPRPGRTIPQETSDLIVGFYENDGCSRLMPGLHLSKVWTWPKTSPKTTDIVQFKRAVSALQRKKSTWKDWVLQVCGASPEALCPCWS